MKNNITKKANAIAPKVIALFIQSCSGITIFFSLHEIKTKLGFKGKNKL